MTLYLLIPLTAAVASAALATAIFVRDPKQRANRLAARLVAGVTFWSLCEVLWNLQSDRRRGAESSFGCPTAGLGLHRAAGLRPDARDHG